MEKEYSLKKEGKSADFDYIDQDGVSNNTPYEWLWTGILRGCGCGSAEDYGKRAYEILELFATPHAERTWSVYDKDADEILAHWVDSMKLAEHGSSIGGSWLTPKGEQVYKSIKALIQPNPSPVKEEI